MYGDLGHLGDIPYDLANTIANIYYEFFKIDKGLQKEGIPKDYFKSENIFDDLRPFSQRIRRLHFKLEIMRDLITHLREIDQDKQPNLYKLWLSVCYDTLKYDIPNTMKKSGIRRKIERYFKKSKVNEIPRLIDLIQVRKNNSIRDKNNYSTNIKEEIKPTEKETHGDQFTALMIAANQGYESAVKNELELFKGDVNAKGKKGLTALMLAVNKGHINVVNTILNFRVNINEANDDGYTSLMLATNNGFLKIVKILIEKGANLNSKDKSGYTALILASNKGHTDIIRILLEAGADPKNQ